MVEYSPYIALEGETWRSGRENKKDGRRGKSIGGNDQGGAKEEGGHTGEDEE